MGYLRRHTIVVSGWGDYIEAAHTEAMRVFDVGDPVTGATSSSFQQLVSPLIDGMTNGERSFFVAPDGSKEWWDTSDKGDELRAKFVEWLRSPEVHVVWVEVQFGDDDRQTLIVGHSDEETD